MPKQKPEINNHEKRKEEWQNWLNLFIETRQEKDFKAIDHASFLLNQMYWTLAEGYVRKVLVSDDSGEDHKIHQYKIISTSEITIMMVEPLLHNDNKKQRKINAAFAWFVATQILEAWENEGEKSIASAISSIAFYQEKINKEINYPETFAAEHIKWLSDLNIAIDKPILVNAMCWRMFYIACLTLVKKGKL